MIAPKVRADSWAALLSPERQWALFNHHYQVVHGKWQLSCAWAEKEFELSRRPSRAAFYEWLDQMNALEEAHNEEIRTLADERAKNAAAQLTVGSETMRQALTAKMMDLILVAKDPDAADKVMKIVSALAQGDAATKALELKAREVALKQQAQVTKEDQLKLAEKKFEDEQTRRTAAEARADKAEQIAKALQEKVKELEKALKDAGKVNVVDTSKVMDELDKLLGMKK